MKINKVFSFNFAFDWFSCGLGFNFFVDNPSWCLFLDVLFFRIIVVFDWLSLKEKVKWQKKAKKKK